MRVAMIGNDAIEIDLRDAPARVDRALVRALNRSINSGQTVMVKEIAGDTGLKQKDIRAALVKSDASLSNPAASLASSLKRLPLMKFQAKGPYPSRGRGRGVTYRLQGGKNRIENAFIARMQSGHEGVFRRVTKARLKIIELFGPSLGQVFAKFRPAGLRRAYEVFEKNFDHELEFISGNAGESVGGGNDAD